MSTPFRSRRINLAGDQSHNRLSAGRSIRLHQHRSRRCGESDLERKLLDQVGSSGQLGRIGDALEVILKHVKFGSETRRTGRAGHSQGTARVGAAGKGGAARRRRPQAGPASIASAMIQSGFRALNKTLDGASKSGSLHLGLGSDRASGRSHMTSETIGIGGLALRFLQTRTRPPAASTRSK